ncbi:MAG: GNAT family N-acetyltransferase [Flavobacteriaceae bacterium]|nr:GNAT family N-acetyltransferase [Flavobacteriaceae bacterium]
MIVEAQSFDAERLTEIALKSKAFWGYSNELIDGWRDDLTVTPEMFQTCTIFKFHITNSTVGFYILNPPEGNSVVLEMLFVLPEFIGKGIGKQLIQHAFKEAIKLNVVSMTLLADPHAVDFYKSQGFYKIDKKESTIPNRFLPILQKDLLV